MRPLIAIIGASTIAATLVLVASMPGAPRAASPAPEAAAPVAYATADPGNRARVDPVAAAGRAREDRVDRSRRVARGLALPIAGVDLPTDPELLPNATRDFRAGWHEGIDFPAPQGTAVRAVAEGTVVRVDRDFSDWSRDEEEHALAAALELGYTPSATLDRIRGRQVWIDHGGGIVSRYAHLAEVADLAVGAVVPSGAVVGYVGSTGYPEGGPHLHLEIRLGASYLGDGLSADALSAAVAAAFDYAADGSPRSR
jgi:murein DD-endopeptidase MepM/ murein hydrolase activator NlpD